MDHSLLEMLEYLDAYDCRIQNNTQCHLTSFSDKFAIECQTFSSSNTFLNLENHIGNMLLNVDNDTDRIFWSIF